MHALAVQCAGLTMSVRSQASPPQPRSRSQGSPTPRYTVCAPARPPDALRACPAKPHTHFAPSLSHRHLWVQALALDPVHPLVTAPVLTRAQRPPGGPRAAPARGPEHAGPSCGACGRSPHHRTRLAGDPASGGGPGGCELAGGAAERV
eukprot:2130780-Rhodomonas_salina.1